MLKQISEFTEIKNRWTGKVMLPGMTLEMVLEKHKKWLRGENGGERANLSDANLRAADLSGANLSAADLSSADLSDADLRDADLSDADLRDANLRAANLRAADLSGANLSAADLSAANLSAADLSAANLRDANLRDAPFKIENIHQKVYEAASKDGALDMSTWHSGGTVCGTTHCRAGWVVVLAGAAGRTLEWAYGTPAAAALIYLASDPKIGKMPNFYGDNETALADMKERAEKEAASQGGK